MGRKLTLQLFSSKKQHFPLSIGEFASDQSFNTPACRDSGLRLPTDTEHRTKGKGNGDLL